MKERERERFDWSNEKKSFVAGMPEELLQILIIHMHDYYGNQISFPLNSIKYYGASPESSLYSTDSIVDEINGRAFDVYLRRTAAHLDPEPVVIFQ